MGRNGWIWLAAALVLFPLLSQAQEAKPKEKEGPPLKVGIYPWPCCGFWALAQQKGFMKELKLNVEIVPFPKAAEAAKAFAEGNVDLVHEGMGTVIMQALGGTSLKVLTATDFSLGEGIVAKAGIKEPKELKGKTIGVAMDTEAYYLLLRVLDLVNLAKDAVTIEDVAGSKGVEAFAAGKLDALLTSEPYLTQAAKKAKGKIIFKVIAEQGPIVDLLVCSAKAVSDRPDDVLKAMRAYAGALSEWETNSKGMNPILAKAQGVSGTEFGQALSRLRILGLSWSARYVYSGDLEANLGAWAAVLRRMKVITKTVDPHALVEPTMLEKAAGVRQ